MKVLMLTPSYDPTIGGTETVVKNLAINLNKTGVKTDVMTFNMDKKWEPRWKWEIKEEHGFKVFRIPAFNLFGKIPNPMGFFFKVNVIPNPSFRKIIKAYDIRILLRSRRCFIATHFKRLLILIKRMLYVNQCLENHLRSI